MLIQVIFCYMKHLTYENILHQTLLKVQIDSINYIKYMHQLLINKFISSVFLISIKYLSTFTCFKKGTMNSTTIEI